MVACAEPSNAHQEKAMQDVTSAELKSEQDRVAAISDAALPPGSAPMMTWKGYPALQPGPELSPHQLLEQVQALAKAIRGYSDSDPSKVEQVLGLVLPPDAEQERRGVSGRVGKGSYSWAVWKPYPESPGHTVELTLTADACLVYDAIRVPLEANSFRVYVPTFGDDHRISFDTEVGPFLGLFIAVTPDRRDAPTCVTVVSFELGRRDA
ncbi:hypothetical protein XcodCFBP4690_00210 [Xanthomonas codiaei]|uniref:Uncharacterized protein n=1 Tax=Xanthomonas codiaei TaxID=56463 RepID=A0A2S7CZE0_9XANT|nr:hypothetical protein XcodCFBP4690_00210 [Xanthomonas codiaei]